MYSKHSQSYLKMIKDPTQYFNPSKAGFFLYFAGIIKLSVNMYRYVSVNYHQFLQIVIII